MKVITKIFGAFLGALALASCNTHTAAYSTMLQLKNGNIAFYYEESLTLNGWGYDMIYKEIPLEVITSDQYQ